MQKGVASCAWRMHPFLFLTCTAQREDIDLHSHKVGILSQGSHHGWPRWGSQMSDRRIRGSDLACCSGQCCPLLNGHIYEDCSIRALEKVFCMF